MSNTDYVLGTHDEEIERLGLQHRVWLPHASDAWRRGGFTTGQTIVDLGSGPGYASIEFARMVGPDGRVIAIERSERFLAHLEERKTELGLPQIQAIQADLDEPLPSGIAADRLWCRWVCAFVRYPRELILRLGRVIKPGGIVVFHEYGEYKSWRRIPDSPELNEFVDLVMQTWRADGGEPDIGRSIPAWLHQSGFDVLSVKPIVEVLTPADAMWQWPQAFVRVGTERLRSLGVLEAARADEIRRTLENAETLPRVWMTTPLVLEIVAKKLGTENQAAF